MKVVALHGSPGNGRMLRQDTGIRHWLYPDWDKGTDWVPHNDWVAVGFSAGGSRIGTLTHEDARQPLAAVLYESPLLDVDSVKGDFPVLWIENLNGRGSGMMRHAMRKSEQAWSSRISKSLLGKGRHTKLRLAWPPIRHGWDRDLNNYILEWIRRSAILARISPTRYRVL